ncbi:MAG: arsenate reductase (glutaredoxin) [Proteobacteria bacterium]|nr:arsenate reductase (glutaredoxin) [Pseudomonadota bacterium]
MTVTIHHNPGCSNSHRALEIIRALGIEPVIVEYLKTPLSKAELAALVKKLDVPLRHIVRTKEAVYAELKLADAGDDAVLDAVAAHPILLNRPIVVTPKGARLCRPPELVRDLL